MPSFGEVLLSIPTYKYSIGAAQPTQIANIGIKGASQVCGVGSAPMPTLAQEPVPTVGTQVRTPNRVRRVSYSKGSYSSSSNPYYSSSYSSYKTSNGQVRSYGGSAVAGSGSSVYNAGSSTVSINAGQVQMNTISPYGTYNDFRFSDVKNVQTPNTENDYQSQYSTLTKRYGSPPPPKEDGWDRALSELEWGFFSEAIVYTDENGVNYYDENKLYQLWLEYLEQHKGQAPGDGYIGITWDELLEWLKYNTSNNRGYSRLPIGDGVWVMMIMCVGYFLYRKRCM